MQSLPEFLAARNSLVVDCGLTGESLPLSPDHPLKWSDLQWFDVVQSKDQMAASHLEGLLASPDVPRKSSANPCASARVACATAHRGSRPAVALLDQRAGSAGTLPLCPARSLCCPCNPSGDVPMACHKQACYLHLLTMLGLPADSREAQKNLQRLSSHTSIVTSSSDPASL